MATPMLDRRSLLRGLFAAPAVVAIGSLMPIRGIIMPVRGELLSENATIIRYFTGDVAHALVKQVFTEGPPRYLASGREITRAEWRALAGISDVPAKASGFQLRNLTMTKEEFDGHTAPAA